MNKKKEYKGIWWVPAKPENKISGTLKLDYTKKWPRAVLDLNGTFEDIVDSRRTANYPIVLGKTSDGKDITLRGCHQTTFTISIPGYTITSFFAEFVFIGFHFLKSEDITFKSISVNYSYLEEWIGKRLFKSETKQENGKLKEHHAIYVHPENIRFKTKNFDIQLNYRFSHSGGFFDALKLESKAFVEVESEKELPLEKWFSIISNLQNLLSLAIIATGELVYPRIIEGVTRRSELLIKDPDVYSSIEIILGYGEPAILRKTKLYWPLMLFRFEDVSRQPEIYFQNWLDKADFLKPVYDLFFGTLYSPQMYITNQFLNLVQAIESYHRRTTNRNYVLPEEEYNKLVKGIIDQTPEKYRKWLQTKFEYANELSLKKRLKGTINALGIDEILGKNIESRNYFIHKVVVTRNFLTHYDKKLEKNAIPPERLFPYVQRLKMILVACLLKEIGFESSKVNELVGKFFEAYLSPNANNENE